MSNEYTIEKPDVLAEMKKSVAELLAKKDFRKGFHRNTPEFNRMIESMNKVVNLPENSDPLKEQEALIEMNKSAQEYLYAKTLQDRKVPSPMRNFRMKFAKSVVTCSEILYQKSVEAEDYKKIREKADDLAKWKANPTLMKTAAQINKAKKDAEEKLQKWEKERETLSDAIKKYESKLAESAKNKTYLDQLDNLEKVMEEVYKLDKKYQSKNPIYDPNSRSFKIGGETTLDGLDKALNLAITNASVVDRVGIVGIWSNYQAALKNIKNISHQFANKNGKDIDYCRLKELPTLMEELRGKLGVSNAEKEQFEQNKKKLSKLEETINKGKQVLSDINKYKVANTQMEEKIQQQKAPQKEEDVKVL